MAIESKYYSKTLKWWLYRDVVLNRMVATSGGDELQIGTHCRVEGKQGGLELRAPTCDHCGRGIFIKKVPLSWLNWPLGGKPDG